MPSPNLTEITIAIEFLSKYLEGIDAARIALFKQATSLALISKFQDHWFEAEPCRGSAYRCLRSMPGKMDPLLLSVERTCQIALKKRLPEDFSLWIDPGDVSCRLGEWGSVWSLSQAKATRESDATSPISSPANSRKSSMRTVSYSFVPCSPPLNSQTERRASPASPSSYDSACSSLAEESLAQQEVFREASAAVSRLLQA